jgi:hypothetical protein
MRFKNNLPFEKGFFNPVKKEVGFSNLQQLPLSSKVTELESSSHPFCTHTQSGGGGFLPPLILAFAHISAPKGISESSIIKARGPRPCNFIRTAQLTQK